MTKMQILKNNYKENYTVLVKIDDILVTFKQYKRYGLNLLVGKNSISKEFPDIFDFGSAIKDETDDSIFTVEPIVPQLNNDNYLMIYGVKDGFTTEIYLHQIVEFTWLNSIKPTDRYFLDADGNPKYHIHHKDGNKENNSVDNLELITREENQLIEVLNGNSRGMEYFGPTFAMLVNSSKERKIEGYKNIIKKLEEEIKKLK